MSNVLVVDGSVIIYKQFSKVGHLSTTTGIPTGLRYGFTRAIRSYKEKFKCSTVVIAWDTGAPIKKADEVDFLDEYKANRPTSESKQKMYGQLQDLKELIKLTSWSQVEEDGYEADDLIATVTRKLVEKDHRVTVVSTDNDMCQLISDKVSVFAPGKDPVVKNAVWVQKNFGVIPEMLLYYRAAAGDVSDNIPGVGWSKSVLESYAQMLLTASATLKDPTLMGSPEAMEGLAWVAAVTLDGQFKSERESTWRKNITMMRLTPPESMTITKGAKDQKALQELFVKLEFRTLMDKIPELCA